MTRWYRAPEVIILEPYDLKVDVWGLGCVFAELVRFTKPYHKDWVPGEKKALFQGNSCYPISPRRDARKKKTSIVDADDQIIKILNVLGTNQDCSFFKNEETFDYLGQI